MKSAENGFHLVTPACEGGYCRLTYLLHYFSILSFHLDLILEQVVATISPVTTTVTRASNAKISQSRRRSLLATRAIKLLCLGF